MRLILIRHGKAENIAADGTDFHRALTPAGRERLENAYPSLARFLNTKSQCTVWTSPKTRALQTAEILCRYMPNVAPQIKPFLVDGDFASFCQELSSHSHGETLVVIGHEPYLSDWVRELTGLDVHLKKGCGEMLYLPPQSPQRAIRINELGFSQMENLDLFQMPFALALSILIKRQHEQIINAHDTFLEDPDDSAALSALRVALRSQYALLEFAEPYCKRKPFRKAEELYLSLYNALEELRDTGAVLKTIHNSRKLELVTLADAMVIEQNGAVMTLCDELSREDSENNYREALHQTIAALMTAGETAPLESIVREQLTERYRLVLDAICSTDFSDLKNIEHLRRICKSGRYLFEFFNPLANYQLAQQYLRIRRLNQRLSIYCDTFYNIRHLEKLLGNEPDPQQERALRIYRQMMAESAATQMESVNRLIDEFGCNDEDSSEKPKKKKNKAGKRKKNAKKS